MAGGCFSLSADLLLLRLRCSPKVREGVEASLYSKTKKKV